MSGKHIDMSDYTDKNNLTLPSRVSVDPKMYPNDSMTSNEFTDAALKIGVTIDDKGLVLPDVTSSKKEELLNKIAVNLEEIRSRIDAAKKEGKHVLYIPGSYDLVHKGHAFYVQQVIDAYIEKCKESGVIISREDLFVVMLADSDELIKDVKKSKHVDNGGDEPKARPVEAAPSRLIAMASLGVDLTGIIPSCWDKKIDFPTPAKFEVNLQEALNMFKKQLIDSLSDLPEGEEKIKKIEKDIKDLEEGIVSYELLCKNLSSGADLGNVPVQAWQLYITAYINGVDVKSSLQSPELYVGGSITRFVSHDDTKYLMQVLFLMYLAGVGIIVIEDINIGSTSSLIAEALKMYGEKAWEQIAKDKLGNIVEHFGNEAAKEIEELKTNLAEKLRYNSDES